MKQHNIALRADNEEHRALKLEREQFLDRLAHAINPLLQCGICLDNYSAQAHPTTFVFMILSFLTHG